MKALRWYDSKKVKVEDAPDPHILHPKGSIVKLTSTAICEVVLKP